MFSANGIDLIRKHLKARINSIGKAREKFIVGKGMKKKENAKILP